MARQDKRRGGEPYGPDAWGLVTYLREQAALDMFYAKLLRSDIFPKDAARHKARAAQLRRNIRWVLAARRAIERAAK